MNLNMIVDGKAVPSIFVGGDTFFIIEEDMMGKPFKLQISNRQGQKALVFVGVDGTDIVSGNTDWSNPRADSTGYLINSYRSIELTGFRKNEDEVNEFVLTDMERSFNAQTDGEVSARGTLCIEAWHEPRPKPVRRKSVGPPGFETLSQEISDNPRMMAYASASAASESMGFAPEVGTGFGNNVEFKTKQGEFSDRGTKTGRYSWRYNTRAQLESWGVIRPRAPTVNPFPVPSIPGIEAPAGHVSPY